jgi:uncharacterized protein (TIGR03083 family)
VSTVYKDRIEILKTESKSLIGALRNLDLNDWDWPSACTGWSVGDVLGHLTGQDFSLRILRGLQGNVFPPEGSPQIDHHNEDDFAESIFNRGIDTKTELGNNLLGTFEQRVSDIIQVFEQIQPDQWDTLCYWPPGPEAVSTMLDMRISELTMHAWDIRSRLESSYQLSNSSVTVLIDTVIRAVRRAFRPDPDLIEQVRYRFIVQHDLESTVDIVLSKDGGAVANAGEESPDATFRCSGATYVMIMYGRLKPIRAASEGLLLCDNGRVSVEEFELRFKGG